MNQPRHQTRLPIVHMHTDGQIGRGLTVNPVSCKKGCSACCSQRVNVMWIEAEEALREAGRVQHPIDLDTVKRQAKLAKGENARDYFAKAGPCVFLDKAGACAIYRRRPITCRVTLVKSDPAKCSDPSANVEKYDTSPIAKQALGLLKRESHYQLKRAIAGPMPIFIEALLEGRGADSFQQTEGMVDYGPATDNTSPGS